MEGHLLLAHLPKKIDAGALFLLDRKLDLVLRKRRLDGPAKRGFRLKKPVRGNHAANPLVRAKMIVMRDEMPEALPRLRKLLRMRAVPELRVHRLPKTLALPHRLGVVGPGHDMLDALADEEPLEVALPPPCEVLPPLVG